MADREKPVLARCEWHVVGTPEAGGWATRDAAMSLRDAWETRAPDWVRWARSPELDNDFWGFHLPEFLAFVPGPGRLTVDVGCGEGRLGRVLAGWVIVSLASMLL